MMTITAPMTAARNDFLKTLQPGDWLIFMFGFERHWFYVLRNHPENLCLTFSKPGWCVSSAHTLAYGELGQGGEVIHVGRTKKRWWWRFFPFRDLVPPFPRPLVAKG